MKQRIRSYLLEQGIDIDDNMVKDTAQVLGFLLIQANIESIDKSNIWKQDEVDLSFRLPENMEDTLCCLFAVCDTVKTHLLSSSLSIFLLNNQEIIRVSHSGKPQISTMPVNNQTAHQHLAARVALSAWFNQVKCTDEWVQNGELSAEFYPNNMQCWALPICTETGSVLGVVYGENAVSQTIDNQQFAWALGLAIVLRDSIEHLLQHFQAA